MPNLKENKIFQYIVNTSIALLVLYAIWFMLWTVLYTETGNGDNVEHLHSTWLVYNNKIPYKDFFQHHNPLMWYIFAPIVGNITNEIILLDLAHATGMIAGVIAFIFVYKISSRFFASKTASIISILVLSPPFFYIYCFNFNPDTFMALSYAVGLYYLFRYWEKQSIQHLVISFFSFFLSFLFTQKILVVLFVLGLLSLFVFYKQKAPISDILYALLMPIMGLGVFLAYFYNNSMLELYWQTNYLFNIEMQEYYGNNKIVVVDREFLDWAIILSILSILCFFIKSKIYFKIISIMLVTEAIQRYFYFAISPYYMLPLMIYMVCINSVIIEKIIQKRYELIVIFIAIACYYAHISEENYLKARGKDRSFANYIAATINPCDYILSSFLGSQSIANKDPHYYWALLGHIDIAGDKMKIHPKPNVSDIVLRYKPKIIYGGDYFDNYAKNRGYYVPVQKVDPYIIQEFYRPTPFPEFYVLKNEYQQHKCQYNKQKGEWEYAD